MTQLNLRARPSRTPTVNLLSRPTRVWLKRKKKCMHTSTIFYEKVTLKVFLNWKILEKNGVDASSLCFPDKAK